MLVIRTAQMLQLAREARKPFARAQASRLRTVFPKPTALLDEKSLALRVDGTLDRAVVYGIVHEPDLELFLDCTFMLAPEFDSDRRYRWASDILNRPDLGGTEKMSMIHDHLLFTGF